MKSEFSPIIATTHSLGVVSGHSTGRENANTSWKTWLSGGNTQLEFVMLCTREEGAAQSFSRYAERFTESLTSTALYTHRVELHEVEE